MEEHNIKLNVQALLEEWISTRMFKDKCLVQVLMIATFTFVSIKNSFPHIDLILGYSSKDM